MPVKIIPDALVSSPIDQCMIRRARPERPHPPKAVPLEPVRLCLRAHAPTVLPNRRAVPPEDDVLPPTAHPHATHARSDVIDAEIDTALPLQKSPQGREVLAPLHVVRQFNEGNCAE